jgi:hypothetical protein
MVRASICGSSALVAYGNAGNSNAIIIDLFYG